MEWKRLHTTFSKMTVSFVAFGLIPLLLLSLLFFYRYSGMIRSNLTSSYGTMTGYVADSVGDILHSVDDAMGELYDYQDTNGNTLAAILKDTSLSESERELAVQDLLRDIMSKSDYISSLRLVDTTGEIYSLFYSQNKTLSNDADSHTQMDVYKDGESLTTLLVFGTLPESEICVSSEDYVFAIARNYMDVSTIESACNVALATLFADINVNIIDELVEKCNLGKGDFYICSQSEGIYIYSSNEEDYLNGSDPLRAYGDIFEGSSGYVKVNHQWVFYEEIDEIDALAVLVLDQSEIMGTFFQSRLVLIIILCFACAVLLILYMAFSIRMSEPTRRLKEAMEQVEQGNLDVRVTLNTKDEMTYVAEGFNKMVERLTDYINQMYVAQICQKDAELNALKMQIQPHYLYNSLDVIRMTALDQGDYKTAELLESLAKQLRYVMGSQADRVLLKEEMDSIREYFVLMKARYEDRISLMIYMADEDGMLVIPKLLLQPIVENAIRHGLRDKRGRGAVAIRVERKPTELEIVVMDDGVGMSEEKVRQVEYTLENHQIGVIEANEVVSLGMKNVFDRIKLNCGLEYGFMVQSALGMGTIVTFTLPIWEEL